MQLQFFSSIALTVDYVHVIGGLADRYNEFVLADLSVRRRELITVRRADKEIAGARFPERSDVRRLIISDTMPVVHPPCLSFEKALKLPIAQSLP